ncbi:MAG: TetR/AcrR family transcriptional regulator [Planctomycetes bacterium]|nr:TetR/AcrR family transcriptional regulator [Planctomycetota bacterium]
MTVRVRRGAGRPKDVSLPGRRCEEILAEASRLFAARGFPGTDLQKVADRLGVGKGTVYRYFPTKEALFLAAVDRGMRLLGGRIQAARIEGKTGVGILREAIRTYLEFFDEYPWVVELLIQERAEFRGRRPSSYFDPKYAKKGPWRKLFRELVRRRVIRRMPVERIMNVAGDLVYGTIFANHLSGRRRSVKGQLEDILDVFFRGILAGRG